MPLPEQEILQTADVLAGQRNPGFETEGLPSPGGFDAPQAAPIPIPGTAQTMGGTRGGEDYLTKFNADILGTKDTGLTPGKLPTFTAEDVTNPRYRSILPGENSEEAFGKAQSGFAQFGNALVKMGATAVGTFLSGMAAIPSTISAIAGNSAYDTALGNNMDQFLDNLENSLPNYYTQWQADHPFASALPFSGGFANFWGDKFLKNIGFTIGAIGSAVATDLIVGAVTEGLGEIPLLSAQIGKAALWLSKIFTGTSRAEELLALGAAAGRTGEQLLDLRRLAEAAQATKVANGAKYAIGLYGATVSEAGFEARDGYNTVKQDLLQSYQREKGYSATGKDLEEIEKYARASGNVRFGVNMALLGVSNAVQLDGILKTFSAAKAGVRSTIQKELETGASIGLTEGSLDVFERLPKTLWGRVRPLVPSILTEGIFEEGGQFATQVATENYWERKYLYDKGLDKSLYKKDKTAFDSRDAIGEVVHSVIRGLSDEFTTDEGLENVLLGGLTGAMFGGVTRWMDRSKRDAATTATLNLLNAQGVTGILQNHYDTAATSERIAQDMKEAVRNNDIYKYKNFQHEQFVNFIMSGVKAGRFDVRMEQLNMLRSMDNEEFKKAFGLDMTTDNVKTVNQYVDQLVTKAEKLKKSYDVINDTFTNPFRYNKKAQTKEENEENQKHRVFEEWKGALTYLASINADVDSRIDSISQDLRSIDRNLDHYHVANFTNRDYLKAYADQLAQEAKGLQGLVDQKVSADPEVDKKRINSLNAKTALINMALNDPNFSAKRFEGLFSNLLNFHLNGQQDSDTQRIPQEAIPKLIEYGRDVNRLRIQRQSAYDAFDKMSTEEGFNRYFREAQASEEAFANRTQGGASTPPGPGTPPPGGGQPGPVQEAEVVPTTQVKSTKGEVKLFEQNKEHFVNLEGKPGANPTKVAVISQNQDGTVTVALPDGTTQNIPADNFFMEDKFGEELDKEVDANTSTEDIPPPAPGQLAEGDMKKDIAYGLHSTTDPMYSRNDIPFNNFHKRHQTFLFNMGSSDPAEFNQSNKPKLRIIPVTAKTYKALGFPDNFIVDDGSNADNSTIRAVYVVDDTVEEVARKRQRDSIVRALQNKNISPEMKALLNSDPEAAIKKLLDEARNTTVSDSTTALNNDQARAALEDIHKTHFLLAHVTSKDAADAIFNSQLDLGKNALPGTMGLLSPSHIMNNIEAMQAGQEIHKRSGGMFIAAIPRQAVIDFLGKSTKITGNDIETYLEVNFPQRAEGLLPAEFNFASFGNNGFVSAYVTNVNTSTYDAIGKDLVDRVDAIDNHGFFFADEKGDKLGRVGQPVDPNKAVFSTFADTNITFETAPGVSGPRYTNKENVDEAQAVEWWRQQRADMLSVATAKDAMQRTYPFEVSRGIPNIIQEGSRNNPIEVVLIKEADLDKPIITVPTLGEVAVMGAYNEEGEGVSSMKSRVKMPLGTPLLNYGGNLIYLTARKFTNA